MQARVSRRVDALGLPAAVCCSSGRTKPRPLSAGAWLAQCSSVFPAQLSAPALGGESCRFFLSVQ